MIEVSACGLSDDDLGWLRTENAKLEPHQHVEDCPVRHGASSTCVWPLAVCVPKKLKEERERLPR